MKTVFNFKYLCLVLVLMGWPLSLESQAHYQVQPRWATNLREGHSFLTFDRPGQPLGVREQGVVFITSDWLAIFQVNERLSPLPLGKRDRSGGAGNFVLDLEILDAHDGRKIKSMRLPTNGEFSEVIPAGGGKLVVRTGDLLYLLSPAFKVLASRTLPLERVAPFEEWHVRAPRSGAEIVLVHQQVFIHEVVLADGTIATPGKAKTDVEILDTDTLKVIKRFSLDQHMAHWSAMDQFLVGAHPNQPYHAEEFGLLDFDGHWTNLKPTFKTRKNCPPIMDALDHQLIAAYGCNGIVVFSKSGEQVFYSDGRANEWPVQVANSGNYLAVELFFVPDVGSLKSRPSHIDLFDIKGGSRLISLPLQTNTVYYDVSAQGLFAVLEGDTLRVFAPANE